MRKNKKIYNTKTDKKYIKNSEKNHDKFNKNVEKLSNMRYNKL